MKSNLATLPLISIALPASVLGISDDLRLKTIRAGLIGRAAAVFMVDEIIIYLDDERSESSENQRLFSKLLRYMAVPQYLRRMIFKKEEDLRFVGLLPPLKIPSHTVPSTLKEVAPGSFRLSFVLKKSGGGLILEAGLERRFIAPPPKPPLDAKPGDMVLIRVKETSKCSAEIVDTNTSPFYLGYRVVAPKATLGRCLGTLDAVKIGTSKYGVLAWEKTRELKELISKDGRVLVAFGSPSKGLREILAMEGIKIEDVFDIVLNIVDKQGTETIRTEEAILITLPLVTALARGILKV